MRGDDDKKREIKLLCPSLSKIVVPIVAWEEERLDLGSIARVLGLDPATLKINGHFISRGVDLIASSVTWKSLLSFFSARGLSTGHSHSAPIILEGKLSKVGSKRSHSPTEVENGLFCKKELNNEREKHHEDTNPLSNKKFKESTRGLREEQVDFPKADRPLLCSLASEKLKRIRDDEMVVTTPFKRIR